MLWSETTRRSSSSMVMLSVEVSTRTLVSVLRPELRTSVVFQKSQSCSQCQAKSFLLLLSHPTQRIETSQEMHTPQQDSTLPKSILALLSKFANLVMSRDFTRRLVKELSKTLPASQTHTKPQRIQSSTLTLVLSPSSRLKQSSSSILKTLESSRARPNPASLKP